MSYTDTTTFNMGATVVSTPTAKLTDTAGSVLAAAVTTGWQSFLATNGNSYTFTYVFPDNWRGTLQFFDGATATGVSAGINPPVVGGGGGVAGSGATQCLLTLQLSDGTKVADADCWITSDAAGTVVVAGTKQTDSAGQVRFMLDVGTAYYAWFQKDGVVEVRGQLFTAEAG